MLAILLQPSRARRRDQARMEIAVRGFPRRAALTLVPGLEARRSRQAMEGEHDRFLPGRVAVGDGLPDGKLVQPAAGARQIDEIVLAQRLDGEAAMVALRDQPFGR